MRFIWPLTIQVQKTVGMSHIINYINIKQKAVLAIHKVQCWCSAARITYHFSSSLSLPKTDATATFGFFFAALPNEFCVKNKNQWISRKKIFVNQSCYYSLYQISNIFCIVNNHKVSNFHWTRMNQRGAGGMSELTSYIIKVRYQKWWLWQVDTVPLCHMYNKKVFTAPHV